MNGALNVITSFLISETYAFNDPEQVKIFYMTTTMLKGLLDFAVLLVWPTLFPDWMIRRGWHKTILLWLKPQAFRNYDLLFGQAFPFWIEKIQQHKATLDCNAPRDYLDSMLIEAQSNEEIGFHSIAMTTIALYAGL